MNIPERLHQFGDCFIPYAELIDKGMYRVLDTNEILHKNDILERFKDTPVRFVYYSDFENVYLYINEVALLNMMIRA